MALKLSAVQHPRFYPGIPYLEGDQFDQPVVDEDAISDAHVARQLIVGDGDLALFPLSLVDEHDVLAHLEIDRLREVTDSDARSLQIAEDGDGLIRLLSQLTNHGNCRGVLLVSTVREIHARDIHSGLDQPANRLIGRGRGAQRTNDLRARSVDARHFPPGASEPTFASRPAINSSKDF